MIAKYNRTSLMLGVPGLLLQIGCFVGASAGAANTRPQQPGANPASMESMPIIFQLGVFLGGGMLIVGLCYYAKAKGYNPLWGLVGLLSCLGLLILAVMPDKTLGTVDEYRPSPPRPRTRDDL